MGERFHYSHEQTQSIRDDVFAKLEAGVASIHDSASFQRYLALQAKFHHYSAYNVALILAQQPEATQVASFRTWDQAFHRRVKRGEKAIRILAPTFARDEHTGEQVLSGFIPVPVFDIGQTEGDPLPAPERPLLLEGQEGGALFDALLEYAGRERIHVRMARYQLELDPGTNGSYDPRRQEIRLRVNPMQQMAKTLGHELAHHVHLRYIGAQSENRSERETVAESAAYVVTNHFGIDSGEYTFPYVAAWSGSRERFKAQLGVIQKVSAHIIDGLEHAPSDAQTRPAAATRFPPSARSFGAK